MTILKDSTDKALKALNGAKCVILSTEEAELLHLNSNVTLITDNGLCQLQFGGISPIVGTEYYVVGMCQAWGDWNTMLATKADIIAAQNSTGTPLVEVPSQAPVEVAEISAKPAAISATSVSTPTRGAFSGYVLH